MSDEWYSREASRTAAIAGNTKALTITAGENSGPNWRRVRESMEMTDGMRTWQFWLPDYDPSTGLVSKIKYLASDPYNHVQVFLVHIRVNLETMMLETRDRITKEQIVLISTSKKVASRVLSPLSRMATRIKLKENWMSNSDAPFNWDVYLHDWAMMQIERLNDSEIDLEYTEDERLYITYVYVSPEVTYEKWVKASYVGVTERLRDGVPTTIEQLERMWKMWRLMHDALLKLTNYTWYDESRLTAWYDKGVGALDRGQVDTVSFTYTGTALAPSPLPSHGPSPVALTPWPLTTAEMLYIGWRHQLEGAHREEMVYEDSAVSFARQFSEMGMADTRFVPPVATFKRYFFSVINDILGISGGAVEFEYHPTTTPIGVERYITKRYPVWAKWMALNPPVGSVRIWDDTRSLKSRGQRRSNARRNLIYV